MSQIPFIQVDDDEPDVIIDLNADNNAAATLETAASVAGNVNGFNLHLPDLNLPATEMGTHSGSRILDGSDPDSSGNQVGSVINMFGRRNELSGRDPNPDPDFGDEDVLESMFHHLAHAWRQFVRERDDLRFVRERDDLRFVRERDDDEGLSDEDDDNAIQGRPPASKASVENLEWVVITQDHKNDNESCGVCKDELNVGERAKQLPCCHRYHGDCILPWLDIRNTCPLCRYELPTDDPDYELRRRANAMA